MKTYDLKKFQKLFGKKGTGKEELISIEILKNKKSILFVK